MIAGAVTSEGEPIITLPVAGRDWSAVIDTGFSGDLELPDVLRPSVNPRFVMTVWSILAAGRRVREDVYRVDFPFDGRMVAAEATFAPTDTILVGTHLLRRYRLAIDFPAQTVLLDRVP